VVGLKGGGREIDGEAQASGTIGSSSIEGHICRLPSRPLRDIWDTVNGLQVYPGHFREDTNPSYGLLHQSVLGRQPLARHQSYFSRPPPRSA